MTTPLPIPTAALRPESSSPPRSTDAGPSPDGAFRDVLDRLGVVVRPRGDERAPGGATTPARDGALTWVDASGPPSTDIRAVVITLAPSEQDPAGPLVPWPVLPAGPAVGGTITPGAPSAPGPDPSTVENAMGAHVAPAPDTVPTAGGPAPIDEPSVAGTPLSAPPPPESGIAVASPVSAGESTGSLPSATTRPTIDVRTGAAGTAADAGRPTTRQSPVVAGPPAGATSNATTAPAASDPARSPGANPPGRSTPPAAPVVAPSSDSHAAGSPNVPPTDGAPTTGAPTTGAPTTGAGSSPIPVVRPVATEPTGALPPPARPATPAAAGDPVPPPAVPQPSTPSVPAADPIGGSAVRAGDGGRAVAQPAKAADATAVRADLAPPVAPGTAVAASPGAGDGRPATAPAPDDVTGTPTGGPAEPGATDGRTGDVRAAPAPPAASTATEPVTTARPAAPTDARAELVDGRLATIADQVRRAEVQRLAGQTNLGLDVVTDHLGAVRIEAVGGRGELQMNLASDDAGARAALAERLPELREQLRESGLDLTSLDVTARDGRDRGASGRPNGSTATNASPNDAGAPSDPATGHAESTTPAPADLDGGVDIRI